MASRRRIVLIFSLLLSPAACLGQVPIAPPVPTGPPLATTPALPSARPTWLEDDVRPAAGISTEAPNWPGATWPPPPAGYGTHESACTFGCPNPIFQPGATSTQVLVGAYFSSWPGPTIPTFDYVPVTLRQGWMLGGPGDGGIGRGTWEALVDVTGATVATNYGTWLAGSSVYLRYNLTDLGLPVVPYHQVGAGFLLNDAYRDQTQRAIGQMFEFHLHYEVGLRYFVAPNMSIDLEGGFHHISNANQADRNFGVNAFGAQIGFTYYFPWGQQ